jgi:hypothetical protein
VSTRPAKLRWSATIRDVLKFSTLLFFVAAASAGCGAPGEPVAPSPPVAAPISDLSGQQAGDGVQLTFTMPTRSLRGEHLVAPPAVEILRGTNKQDGSPDLKSLRLVGTVPAAVVENYSIDDKFQFFDPITPAETKSHPGAVTIYAVRTRLSSKRASGNSNIISLHILGVPQPVGAIEVKVTEPAIELSWSPIDRTSAGDPLSAVTYNIYRAEFENAADAPTTPNAAQPPAEEIAHDAAQLKLDSKLQLLATQADHSYSDKSFEFGKAYVYVLRSVASDNGAALESSDSQPVVITPRDTFPPAVPKDISYAVLPGENPSSVVVELSWSINSESDFAGYHVYRSDQPDAKGTLLTPDLLPTPAYRDTSVQPPHRYWYTVTAVDRSGNESAPSAATAVEVAQPSP